MIHKYKKSFFIVTLIFVAVLLLVSCNSSEKQNEEKKETENRTDNIVRLTGSQIKEFGVEVAKAGPGELRIDLTLPGEIVANADRLAHIVSRVPGVVREVRKSLGDRVQAGEVLAVIDSRELADMKSAFLAAKERVGLAETNFKREEDLWKKKISAEQEYLQAKQALAETNIELRSADQKLHAIGFSQEYIDRLQERPEASFTRYEITAPIRGTVIQKHVAKGESVKDDTEIFIIADLSSVWVNLNVNQKDLHFVREGQKIQLAAREELPEAEGEISYVGSTIDEKTRTAFVRIVLENAEGHWRPGMFVTGRLTIQSVEVPVLVPKTALQTMDEKTSIFVRASDGFKPVPVSVARSDDQSVEITSGLEPGQEYVSKGSFLLKSELAKDAFGEE